MIKTIKINDELSLEIVKKKRRTLVFLYDGMEKTVLSDIKTSEFFWSKVVYDENYIVVYTRGCMVNEIPLNVEVAFSIKNKSFINLENKKIKIVLQYMFICKKYFDLTQVLQTINDNELLLVSEDEKGDLESYLTAGSDKIDSKQVIDYILDQYPCLINYTNLSGPISVVEYKKIEEEMGKRTLEFHIMPLPLECIENSHVSANNLDATNYRQIYLSEYEHNAQ